MARNRPRRQARRQARARKRKRSTTELSLHFSILGLVAAGHGAAAVNNKHRFLISSQLANQFNFDLDSAPGRRARRFRCGQSALSLDRTERLDLVNLL
jgi:hypothetical protein